MLERPTSLKIVLWGGLVRNVGKACKNLIILEKLICAIIENVSFVTFLTASKLAHASYKFESCSFGENLRTGA